MIIQKPEILHVDADIIIVSKPSGMLSIPDRFNNNFPNVRKFLLDNYEEVFTVHRLDRDTSGIILFARNAESHRELSLQFEHHQVDKKYNAIVRGIMDKESMEIDIPLIPDSVKKGLMKPSARGKESFTHVEVIERFRMATFVECTPKTGRMHQIRVHLSAVGHPLLVDADYGGISEFKLSTIKRKYKLSKNTEEKPILSRVPLHASSLTFKHPASNETVSFSCEMPKDMLATLQLLRKYAAYQDFSSLSSFDEWL